MASAAASARYGHTLLETRGARVLGAQLATHVPAVDGLAEDCGLPECEPFKPCEWLDITPAPRDVALHELGPRREAR